MNRTRADVPQQIESCTVTQDLDEIPLPTKPVVSFVQTPHDRIAIEIMRGCPWQCRFCQSSTFEHLFSIGFVQFCNFGFQLGTNRDHRRPDLRSEFPNLLYERVFPFQIVFVDVGHIKNRLGCHQPIASDNLGIRFFEGQFPQWFFRGQMSHALANHFDAMLGILVAALGGSFRFRQ